VQFKSILIKHGQKLIQHHAMMKNTLFLCNRNCSIGFGFSNMRRLDFVYPPIQPIDRQFISAEALPVGYGIPLGTLISELLNSSSFLLFDTAYQISIEK
jgi:hypothetical protein